jgi:hypothetical protein
VFKRTMIAGFAVAAAAGCGRAENRPAEEAAQQIQQAAEQVQQGAGQVAQSLQQMAQSQAEVVDFEVLKGLLPSVNGWTQSGARGEQVSMPMKFSHAEARYSRGESSVALEITDSALNQMLLAPMSMFLASGYSERSDDGFKRATKIGGHPGVEDWNSGARRGEITAVVNNRFIVQATGHDVDDLAAVRQVVDAIDLAKLSALK